MAIVPGNLLWIVIVLPIYDENFLKNYCKISLQNYWTYKKKVQGLFRNEIELLRFITGIPKSQLTILARKISGAGEFVRYTFWGFTAGNFENSRS